MKAIQDLDWNVNLTLSREHVIALGKLASFIGNICKDTQENFPSSAKDIDFNKVREAFGVFTRAYETDKSFLKRINELAQEMATK